MAAPAPVEVLVTDHNRSASQVLTTATGTAAGDTLVIIYGSNYYSISDMPDPTSSAGTPSLVVTADAGNLASHIKAYVLAVGSGGAQSVTIPSHNGDSAIFGWVLRFSGAVVVDVSAGIYGSSSTTSHAAPSVITTGADRLLVCAWMPVSFPGSYASNPYTLSGMTSHGQIWWSPYAAGAAASDAIASAGATGTRTATIFAATTYVAVSLAVAADSAPGDVTGVLAGTAPAPQADFAGAVTVHGQLAGTAPAAVAAMQGVVAVSGVLAGTAPAATAEAVGAATVSGALAGTAPAATGEFSGSLSVTGEIAGVAPAAEASFVGAVAGASGVLAGVAPAATGVFAGAVVVHGALGGQAPAAEGVFVGEVEAAGGVLSGTAPAAVGAFSGRARVSGALDGVAPAAVGALDGVATVRGGLAGTAPAAVAAMAGQIITPSGVLAGVAPAAVGEFTGISYAVAARPARLSSGSSAAVDLSSSVEQLVTLKGGTA